MLKGSNEEKILKISKYWFETGLPLNECIKIVEPDIKLDVLKKMFTKQQEVKHE